MKWNKWHIEVRPLPDPIAARHIFERKHVNVPGQILTSYIRRSIIQHISSPQYWSALCAPDLDLPRQNLLDCCHLAGDFLQLQLPDYLGQRFAVSVAPIALI
eukprot:5109347-Pleurochrysis_carterae.AAC.6